MIRDESQMHGLVKTGDIYVSNLGLEICGPEDKKRRRAEDEGVQLLWI